MQYRFPFHYNFEEWGYVTGERKETYAMFLYSD